MLSFEEGKYRDAVESFRLLSDRPNNQWSGAANYYLGLTYERMGDTEASLLAYHNSDIYKLSSEVLERLTEVKF